MATKTKGHRNSGRDRRDHIDNLGCWMHLLEEKLFGPEGKRLSPKDVLLRQDYKRATEGNIKAIRNMMALFEAALEQEKGPPKAWDPFYKERPEVLPRADPANADLGLLLLGIGAFDDRCLKRVGSPGDLAYDAELKQARVTRLEGWVHEFAKKLNGRRASSDRDDLVMREFEAASPRTCGQWYANREQILSDLMRLRGPAGARFQRGRSGNPRGRPTVRRVGMPVDDFFMVAVEVNIGGKMRTMTRLDALMHHLILKALNGDQKIARLIMPTLLRMKKEEWLGDGNVFDETYKS